MDKYRVTTAELFKIKMQLRAEINYLRKTYDQIVIEKHTPEKKHYPNRFHMTSVNEPYQQKSMKKQAVQRRHYSPNMLINTSDISRYEGKKQFVYKNQHQDTRRFNASKRKSSSYLVNVGRSSQSNLKNDSTGLSVDKGDKSQSKLQRPSKKIFLEKHQFNKKLI